MSFQESLMHTQRRQKVSQLRRRYETISILVKMTQALDKVIRRVGGTGLADCLVDW